MSDVKQPYQKLIQNINKNTIVIASSSNLAIDLKEQYTLDKLSKLQHAWDTPCLLYTSPSPRDKRQSRMPACG